MAAIRRPRALGLCAVVALFGMIAATPAQPPLRAMRWLDPDADPVRVMLNEPAECLAAAADPETAWRIEVGRAAFRTPLLLGGQAARAGVDCATCHRNGRGNQHFLFPGLSGAAGTADVTSSLLSSHRGDSVDNPVVIPDLGGSAAGMKVARTPQGRALETFVHGLVTQEFDGAEPPPAVLDGLAAYVRAIAPENCPGNLTTPITLRREVDVALRAVIAAEGALRRQDSETAQVMLNAARTSLGRIDERYSPPGLERHRERLRRASVALVAIQDRVRQRDPAAAIQLGNWRLRSAAWRAELRGHEAQSLFNAVPLRAALGPPVPVTLAIP